MYSNSAAYETCFDLAASHPVYHEKTAMFCSVVLLVFPSVKPKAYMHVSYATRVSFGKKGFQEKVENDARYLLKAL